IASSKWASIQNAWRLRGVIPNDAEGILEYLGVSSRPRTGLLAREYRSVAVLVGCPHRTARLAPPILHTGRQVLDLDGCGVFVLLAGWTEWRGVIAGRCLHGLVHGH